MKVLWFTNIPLPGLSRILGKPPEVIGGWMSALLDELRRRSDVEIAVATIVPGQRAIARHLSDGVTYYCLPTTKTHVRRLTPAFMSACEAVVTDFGPEIIHVHGTEELYGRFTAERTLGPPAVISIQGLIHVCSRHVAGGLGLADASEAGLAGMLSWLRFMLLRQNWARRGRAERRILAANTNFIGRTEWDKAHLLANNRTARYFHCGELLRPAFYQRRWDARAAARQSIFCTAAHSPLKGFHLVLDAVTMLREEFPEIMIRVAGAPWDADRGFGYYGRFLKALIDRRGLSRHVTPLPALSAEQVAEELAAASAFVIPSLIENSPNSLAEAMLVGTPCVAAFVGGIPSMIESGYTALCFPSGDAAYLAQCIRQIFKDNDLAQELSTKARLVASSRHHPETVLATLLDVYRHIVAEDRGVRPSACA